ncbi:MAG: hypothetical protein KF838_01605 [Phycisphaeraceae bacterium]|nr:MAG: hypothetical protein KF838_01605 [Phycisphaeraceae bacterium]
MAKKASGSGASAGASRAAPKAGAKRASRGRGGDAEQELAAIVVPRPRPLDELIGQERAISVLGAAFTTGRLHHAWIFAGPKGVGKFMAALGFAAAALDPTTRVGEDGVPRPDPESRVQRLLRAGTHPDFHVIVKELAKFSEDREVRERKQTTIPTGVTKEYLIDPIEISATLHEGGLASKVFIVDEAELMDPRGQNQLLKTLEEPPEGSLLILVTSVEERLLPTVRSRCQRVGFGPLSDEALSAWMRGSEEFASASAGVDQRTMEWLLRVADGSPGVLMGGLACGMGEWGPRILPMLERVMSGEFVVELGPAMASIADEIAAAHVSANPNASKEQANKDAGRLVLSVAAEGLRWRVRSVEGGAQRLERVCDAVDVIREADRLMDANVSLAFLMESTVVGITRAMSMSR